MWATALAIGFGLLVTYQMRAGPVAAAPDVWPEGVALPFDSQRSNLVMFAHPKCPCSTASLEELKIVLTRGREDINSTICFFEPDNMPADWSQTRLVRAARELPGLNVIMDPQGNITDRFGAMTSGQILLFDRHGRRIFSGGITSARGHAGENQGRTLVLALARGEVCAASATPVYGCELHDADGRGETTTP